MKSDKVDIKEYSSQGVKVNVGVFEKYYFRVNSMAALSITTISDGESVKVLAISSGGGEGIFNMDWGAADSFLNKYIKKLDSLLAGRKEEN